MSNFIIVRINRVDDKFTWLSPPLTRLVDDMIYKRNYKIHNNRKFNPKKQSIQNKASKKTRAKTENEQGLIY